MQPDSAGALFSFLPVHCPRPSHSPHSPQSVPSPSSRTQPPEHHCRTAGPAVPLPGSGCGSGRGPGEGRRSFNRPQLVQCCMYHSMMEISPPSLPSPPPFPILSPSSPSSFPFQYPSSLLSPILPPPHPLLPPSLSSLHPLFSFHPQLYLPHPSCLCTAASLMLTSLQCGQSPFSSVLILCQQNLQIWQR